MDELKIVYTLLADGGPIAVAVLALTAWFLERKENRIMTRQMVELVTAQVKIQTENKLLLETMRDLLNRFIDRI